MPISTYMRDLRAAVGTGLVLCPSVAAVIRDAGGRILLLQKAVDGRWSLPAGGIEPGESPEAAVHREVAKETGLTVKTALLVAALGGQPFRTRYPNGDEVEFTVCVFACTVGGGALRAVDGEALRFRWAEPSQVSGLLDLPYPPALFDGSTHRTA